MGEVAFRLLFFYRKFFLKYFVLTREIDLFVDFLVDSEDRAATA